MANINNVVLSGRLGGDPEIKYFDTGSVKVSFSLGVNKWSKKDNKELVNWYNVEVWGKQAEYIAEYAKKGTRATILGSLDTSSWQDDAGNNRKKIFIVANTVEIEGKKSGQSGQSAAQSGELIGADEIPF